MSIAQRGGGYAALHAAWHIWKFGSPFFYSIGIWTSFTCEALCAALCARTGVAEINRCKIISARGISVHDAGPIASISRNPEIFDDTNAASHAHILL